MIVGGPGESTFADPHDTDKSQQEQHGYNKISGTWSEENTAATGVLHDLAI